MKIEMLSKDEVVLVDRAEGEFQNDMFLRLTKDNGEVLVLAIPDMAFQGAESPYSHQPTGLNLVFAGHYA